MPTGPKVFLTMPDACGLWPCVWTHLKKALCHTRSFGGACDKYEYLYDHDSTNPTISNKDDTLITRVDFVCFVDVITRRLCVQQFSDYIQRLYYLLWSKTHSGDWGKMVVVRDTDAVNPSRIVQNDTTQAKNQIHLNDWG